MSSQDMIRRFKIFEGDHHLASHKLYLLQLSAYKHEMDGKSLQLALDLEFKLYNLLDVLREQKYQMIVEILVEFSKQNPYIADLLIIMWCLPRPNKYLSVISYNEEYKDIISKYNYKMVCLISHEVVKRFCIETISKVNNVPIHCIDYVWYYLQPIYTVDFSFSNSSLRNYFMVKEIDNDTIVIGLDISFIIQLGLGKQTYNKMRPSFEEVIRSITVDENIVNALLCSKTGENYKVQREELIRTGFILF